jgi:hypothetical protein
MGFTIRDLLWLTLLAAVLVHYSGGCSPLPSLSR